MKINAITESIKSSRVLNNNLKYKSNSALKSKADSFSFTSNLNNSMTKAFKERIKDSKERESIAATIISDSKGNYRLEVEKLFLNKLNFSAKCLERDGVELNEETFPYLVKAAGAAFRAVKDGDEFVIGKNKNPIDVLTRIGYIALLNGVENLEDSFDYAKTGDKIIDIPTLQIILQWESCFDYDFSPKNSADALKRYCSNGNTIDFEAIIPVGTLFSNADCLNFEECDRVYNMILDEDGKINIEKRNFLMNALNLIKYLFNDNSGFEYYTKDGHINDNLKNDGIYRILENFLNKIRLSKKEFDAKEAYERFEDIVVYAVNNKLAINRNTLLNIQYFAGTSSEESELKTVEEYCASGSPEGAIFLTPFYRVYSVIVDEGNCKTTA